MSKIRCHSCFVEYDPSTDTKECPHYPIKKAVVAVAKEHIRIVTKSGHFFDMDKPSDFNMASFMTVVRAQGAIINDQMYQPLDWVASIFIWSDTNPPVVQNLVNATPAGNA